jgi:TonB family protein
MARIVALALPLALALAFGCAPSQPSVSPSTGPSDSGKPSTGDVAPPGTAAATAPAAGSAPDTAAAKGPAASDAPINTPITQEEVLALVQKNADAFYRCYTVGAGGAKKGYKAKVKVKATVSPAGAVNAIEVLSSTTNNAKVDACVLDTFKKLTFTRPKGSGATVFTFPLSFDGIEQVQ